MSAKKLALCAVLTALALGLSLVERFIPIWLIVPVPGVKLGLANIVTMFALLYLGAPYAALVLAARCVLGALAAGSLLSLAFSLLGGFFALGMMLILKPRMGKSLSLFGLSMAGAAAHGAGQMAAAVLTLKSLAVLSYLPVLLLCAPFTGALMAAVSLPVFGAAEKTGLVSPHIK